MDDFEKRRKKLLGGSSSESSNPPQETSSFEERRTQLVNPSSNESKSTTKPVATSNQSSFWDNIKKKAGEVADAIRNNASKINLTPQPQEIISPIPDSQRIKPKAEKDKNFFEKQQDIVQKYNYNPQNPLYAAETIVNVIDTAYKGLNAGIKGAQDAIYQASVKRYEQPDKQTFTDKLTLAVAEPLAVVQKNVLEPALFNPVTAPITKGFTSQYLGGSKEVANALQMRVPHSDNKLIQGYNTVGELTGATLSFIAGGFILKGLNLGRAAMPVLFATLGQTSADSDTTVQQRLEKMPVDAVAGWLISKVPAAKKLLSPETLKGVGLTAGVMSGDSFVDSLIEGLPPEEAAKEAAKMAVIAGLFHVGGTTAGLFTNKVLASKYASGKIELTPEQAKVQINNTDFTKPEAVAARDVLIKATRQAEAQGKNLSIDMGMAEKSAVAKLFNAKTPAGRWFTIDLVEPQAKPTLLESSDPVAGQSASLVPVQPVTPKVAPVKVTTPPIPVPETFRTPTEKLAYEQIKENPEKIVDDYVAQNNNEVDPDKIRQQFTAYEGHNVVDFNRPVGQLKDKIYSKLIEENKGKGNNTVLITAGGSGSGKTSAVANALPEEKFNYAVILDSTFSYNSAHRDVLKALNNGYNVDIAYTLRDPVQAWVNGVIPRVKSEGRIVSEDYFLSTHEKARQQVLEEYAKYKDDPRVSFSFIDNNNVGGQATLTSFDKVKNFSYNKTTIASEIAEATEKAYEQKQLTKKEYEAITADRKSGNDVAQGSEQASVRQENAKVPSGDVTTPQNTEGFDSLAFRVNQYPTADEFASESIFNYSLSGREAAVLESFKGENTADKLVDFYNTVKSQERPLPAISITGKTPSEKASQVYERVAMAADEPFRSQYIEQADNPSRYHTPEEAKNPLGLKIGDKVNVFRRNTKGQVLGSQQEYVVGINNEKNAPAYKGGFSVKTVSPYHYGGFTQISDVSKIVDNLKTPRFEAGGAEPIAVSTTSTRKPVVKSDEKVSFTSRQAKVTQSIFTKGLDEIRGMATSQEDLIQRVETFTADALEKVGDNKQKIAGIRTALNKELFAQVGKSGNYKADYAMLQTMKGDPDIGNYLEVLEERVYDMDKKLGRSKSSYGFANIDPFSETLQNVTKEIEKSQFKIIEFPEMLRLAEELMGGNRPVATSSKRGNYRGLFRPKGDGSIVLKTDIFKDPQQAAKTLAHEIGHLIDYLPDKTMARGNLIGRLASLREFMRGSFSDIPTEKKIDELLEKVKALQSQRRALKQREPDSKEFKPLSKEDRAKDLAILQEMRPLNKQIRDLQKNSIKNPVIRNELLNLSAKWRPIPEGTGTAQDIRNDDYRASSVELYADAISVLFNDPARLKLDAPEFWKNFFELLDQKPQVKENFFAIQETLTGDPEKIFRERDEAMNKAFSKAEEVFTAKEMEKRKRKNSLIFQLQVLFDNKNQPVINKAKQAMKKGYKIEDAKNPVYELAGLNYMDSKLKNYIDDTFEPVFAKAQSVTDGWNTLGKVLQLERTIFERGELANPGGYDPKTAQDQLTALEKYTPAADWKVIQEAKNKFREAVQQSINMAEKEGYYTPELITQMKANPAYAAYQVIDYLDTYVSAKVYKAVGTLKDVANPATSTVMKMISMMKAIERNKVKIDTVDMIAGAFPEEVEAAKSVFNGKAQEFLEPKSPDQALVITIRNGKATGHYIDKQIAGTLNYLSNDTINMATKVIRVISASPFYRPLFTSLNLGFQTFNFVRDFERYWKNVPDYTFFQAITSLPRAAFRYAQATPASFRRAAGLDDATIKEMENAQMLGLKYNDIFKDPVDPDESQIERVLQKIGIMDKPKKRKLLTPIYKTLDAVEFVGNFIETLPKVAGYKELKGKMPQQELAHFIRTKVGSPDFRTAGTLTPISNNIFMFSNAIKEGIKSDFEIATGKAGRKSQAGFWWKTVLATILPKIIMAAIGVGLMGEWLKKRMDDVSEYDKTSYTILPLGVDENGKTVYMRIPQDETSRFIGSLFWKGLKLATKDEAGLEDIAQIFAVGSGQFPTVAPSFTGIGATIEYMSGRNPYDSFRGRNVIPDTEFKAGYKASFPIFADWLMKQQGAGIIVPAFTPQGEMTNLDKILNAPFLSNIAGRWIKASDYGQVEINKQIQAEQEKESAEKTIQRKALIDQYVKEWQDSDKSEQTKRDLIVKFTRESTAGITEDRPRQITLARQKIRMALNYGEHGANTDSLIKASSNAAKAQILKRVESSMTADEFIKYKRMLRTEGIISEDVLLKFNRL